MTTTHLVRQQIDGFLKSTTPTVLCVQGEWGVGKTFLWQQILAELESSGSVALKKYSYVSLFGVNSLDSLKMAIFENARSIAKNARLGNTYFRERWNNLVSLSKKNRELGEVLPWIGEALSKAGPLYFSTVTEQIVCIDDLERRSDGLDMKDVLGLASFLKEQRKCKVVFLFNNEEFGSDAEEFSEHFEKVFDVRVTFDPTPEESVSIALANRNDDDLLLGNCCVSLGISNIRVIKKIERFVNEIKPLLQSYHPEVTRQAIVSLALLGWSCYQPKLAPPLDYLRTKGRFSVVGAKKSDEFARNDAQWGGFLKSYGFYLMDELDLTLLGGLETGCIDKPEIEKIAEAMDDRLKRADQDDVFTKAWSLFHDNFHNNEVQLVQDMCAAVKHAVKTISPGNFDSTVRLLRDLGRDVEAEELIKYYVENHGDDRALWDLESHRLGSRVEDPAVRKAFADKLASFGSNTDPLEILKTIGSRRGWNPEDITALASLPVSEYHRILKSHTGDELSSIQKSMFMFDGTINQSPQMMEVAKRGREALRQIAAESTVNRIRVERLGIQLEPPPPQDSSAG
jgi:hypothetical protein